MKYHGHDKWNLFCKSGLYAFSLSFFFAFEFYETTEFPVYIIWKKGLNERRKYQNYMLLMFLRWIHSAFI